MGLSIDVVSGPAGPLARVWTAKCDSPTDFSSIASVNPGIGCVRVGGATTVHLRGPETRAATLSCPRDAEYFGADFRLGAYLPMFPPVRLANLQDVVLPILPDGRILLDGRAWEMPTPQNIDVFIDRLKRAGLLVFDPLVEELQHGGPVGTGSFSRALLEGGQLDELRLWVNPFIAGSGEPLLPGITTTHLDLAEVNEVGNGVVVLTYKPKR